MANNRKKKKEKEKRIKFEIKLNEFFVCSLQKVCKIF